VRFMTFESAGNQRVDVVFASRELLQRRQVAALAQPIFDVPGRVADIGRSTSPQPGDGVRVEASDIGAIENTVS
jgi:hypothetical protein